MATKPPARPSPPASASRLPATDPVVVAVLAACALGLAGVWLHYAGLR